MTRSTLIVLKTLVWISCLAPFCWLVWGALTNNLGPDETGAIAFATGRATLRLLAITLAISPLRRLIPKLAWLIRFRRLLGLFAFFYATVHVLTWVALYNNFDVHNMLVDVARRRYITAGMAAYLSLAASGAHVDRVVHPQAGRQKLEPPAHPHLCRRNLWSGSLLVADEARRPYAAGHDRCHRGAASRSPDPRVAPAPESARGRGAQRRSDAFAYWRQSQGFADGAFCGPLLGGSCPAVPGAL